MVSGKDFIAGMLADDREQTAAPPTGVTLQFTIKRFAFQTLLEKAATVVPSRDVMPVLKNFQFDVTANRLRVIATDLELSMVSSTEMVAVTAPGTAVFPAKKMLDIVREADEGDVDIIVDSGVARIGIGRTTWNLKLAGGADYPPMPETTEVTFVDVDRAAFLSALNAVRYAAAGSSRPNLMLIDIKDGRMTACDGVRFQQAVIGDFPFEAQVPIGAVDDLVKLLRSLDLATISVGESANHIIFRLGHDTFCANKLVAQIPDMTAMLLRPALENKHQLVVDRGELLDAVKRVRINADPETSAVGLHLEDDTLTVSARDKYGNAATETIDVDWQISARVLVVNHAFLIDMINMHPGKSCTFWLGDDTKTRKTPLLLRDDDAGTVGVVQQMNGVVA